MSDNINDKEYTTLYLLIDSTNIYALEELKNKYGHRSLNVTFCHNSKAT